MKFTRRVIGYGTKFVCNEFYPRNNRRLFAMDKACFRFYYSRASHDSHLTYRTLQYSRWTVVGYQAKSCILLVWLFGSSNHMPETVLYLGTSSEGPPWRHCYPETTVLVKIDHPVNSVSSLAHHSAVLAVTMWKNARNTGLSSCCEPRITSWFSCPRIAQLAISRGY